MLSVEGIQEPSPDEQAALSRIVAAGSALLRHMRPDDEGIARAGAFLYRRWVLEMLSALRLRGALGFNELARALGKPHSESLVPKLRSLERARLIVREELGGRPARVRYSLAPPALALGSAVVALTLGKAEHMRAARTGQLPAWAIPEHAQRDPMAEYLVSIETFVSARSRRSDTTGEDALAAARRMSAACVRKWHGPVLVALATAHAPMTFGELRRATGAGDQALANALTGLAELRSVEQVDDQGHARAGRGASVAWRAAPLGLFDLALGAPPLVLTASLHAI